MHGMLSYNSIGTSLVLPYGRTQFTVSYSLQYTAYFAHKDCNVVYSIQIGACMVHS